MYRFTQEYGGTLRKLNCTQEKKNEIKTTLLKTKEMKTVFKKIVYDLRLFGSSNNCPRSIFFLLLWLYNVYPFYLIFNIKEKLMR